MPQQQRDDLVSVTRAVMIAAGNCALITLDESGQPKARAMDPFPPESDLTVWMATNGGTRKVAQLRADRRATLYYLDRAGGGYVTLIGSARIIDNPDDKASHWKPEWDAFYLDTNRGDDYVLIEFTPERAEIVSLEHGIAAEPMGWKPAIVTFEGSRPN